MPHKNIKVTVASFITAALLPLTTFTTAAAEVQTQETASTTAVPSQNTTEAVTETSTATATPSESSTPTTLSGQTTAALPTAKPGEGVGEIGPAQEITINEKGNNSVASSSALNQRTVLAQNEVDTELLRQVNNYRAQYGLPAVTLHINNSTRAKNWSQTMSDAGKTYHDPDWFSEIDTNGAYAGVETVAVAQDTGSAADTAALMLKFWMNSDAHNRALLSNQVNTVGIGSVVGSYSGYSGDFYWATMDFVGYKTASGNPPTITGQPQDVTITSGQTATLKGTYSNATRVQWMQWYNNTYVGAYEWFPVIGGYSNTLSVPNLPKGTTTFRLDVMNDSGITSSRQVTVTVKDAASPIPSGMTFAKYSWSPDIYSVQNGVYTKLSYAQWQNYGYPTPKNVAWIPGTSVFSYPFSSNIYFGLNGSYRHVSYSEWTAAGSPKASLRNELDVVKYSWSNDLFSVSFPPVGDWIWNYLTPSMRKETGYKPYRIAGWIQGTQVWAYKGSPDIYATLRSQTHKLTYSEWQAMGSPAPTYR
ncbi:MAG: CAP domain-containing protein [Micrococcaceae bacterium]